MTKGYAIPTGMSGIDKGELFGRFKKFLAGEEPFRGISERVNLPLQVLIMSYERDLIQLKADMFAFVEILHDDGYVTCEEMCNYVDDILEEKADDLEPHHYEELRIAKDFVVGRNIESFIIDFYRGIMKKYGY